MLTTEQLMKPRYKVIAYYPGCPFNVGNILMQAVDNGKLFWSKLETGEWGAQVNDIHLYPHLFQPLQWWQERDVKDMPEYVKHIQTGRVCRVADANEKYPSGFMIDYPMTECWIVYKDCIPCTEAEYQQYIKSKQ